MPGTDEGARTRAPLTRRNAIALTCVAALTLSLAACATTGGAATADESAAAQAALESIDLAFASAALDDDRDLVPGDDGALVRADAVQATDAPEPRLVMRRVGIDRYRELDAIRIDRSSEPPSAVIDLTVGIRGEARFWLVMGGDDPQREYQGAKRIDVDGPLRIRLERLDGGWTVVGVRRDVLTQGERAAGVDVLSLEPSPLVAGDWAQLAVSLDAPDPADAFAVDARGPVLAFFGPLVPVDDGTYAADGFVPEHTRPGPTLGFVSALNVSATFDLATDEDGGFLVPYTQSIRPVVARVAAQE
jgi:hypothetical protein